MSYWPAYVVAAALAGVALLHWFTLRRLLAVSGRLTQLLQRRAGPATLPTTDEDALAAALRAATLEAFGAEAVARAEAAAPTTPTTPSSAPAVAQSASIQPPWMHLLFFAGLCAGGVVGAQLAPRTILPIAPPLADSGLVPLWLFLGGVLVGFGTRMSGGCTSGHGLCGVSRMQPGSLVATLCFFGAGIVTSFVLGGWS